MTTVRYVRRPHHAAHRCFEYQRARRGGDWLMWAHVALFGALVVALVVAVQCAGGSFSVGN